MPARARVGTLDRQGLRFQESRRTARRPEAWARREIDILGAQVPVLRSIRALIATRATTSPSLTSMAKSRARPERRTRVENSRRVSSRRELATRVLALKTRDASPRVESSERATDRQPEA